MLLGRHQNWEGLETGTIDLNATGITAFAINFGPQPHYLDCDLREPSIFGICAQVVGMSVP